MDIKSLRKGEELLFWILHEIMEIVNVSRLMFVSATSLLVFSAIKTFILDLNTFKTLLVLLLHVQFCFKPFLFVIIIIIIIVIIFFNKYNFINQFLKELQ